MGIRSVHCKRVFKKQYSQVNFLELKNEEEKQRTRPMADYHAGARHGHWRLLFSRLLGCHKCRRAFGGHRFFLRRRTRLFHPVRPFRNDGGKPRRGLVPRIRFPVLRAGGGVCRGVDILDGMVFAMSSEATAVSTLIRGWFPNVSVAWLGAAIITAVTLLNLLGASKLSRLESVLAAVKIWPSFLSS